MDWAAAAAPPGQHRPRGPAHSEPSRHSSSSFAQQLPNYFPVGAGAEVDDLDETLTAMWGDLLDDFDIAALDEVQSEDEDTIITQCKTQTNPHLVNAFWLYQAPVVVDFVISKACSCQLNIHISLACSLIHFAPWLIWSCGRKHTNIRCANDCLRSFYIVS